MGAQLLGRNAVITGGTSGIGLATAERFLAEGAAVVIASRDGDRGAAAERYLRDRWHDVRFVQTDVTVAEEVESLIRSAEETFGRIQVVFSNAGIQESGTAVDATLESWNRVIAVNLTGHFHVAKYAIPALERAGGGSLIVTASELGLVGARSSVAYCASKGGVINLVRALAIDCGRLGIRVNAIAPGPVETPMLRRWFDDADDPAAFERQQVAPVLLRRVGRPEEIASAVLYLASAESAYKTGAVEVVDGGVTAWYGI